MLAGARTWSNAVETTCAEVAQTLSNAIDYEDADGSISCLYLAMAVRLDQARRFLKQRQSGATLSTPGEAAINLLQYVLSNG